MEKKRKRLFTTLSMILKTLTLVSLVSRHSTHFVCPATQQIAKKIVWKNTMRRRIPDLFFLCKLGPNNIKMYVCMLHTVIVQLETRVSLE